MSVYASLCSFHLANISWPVPVQGAVTEKVQPQAWLQYPKACPGRMGMSSQETCETSEASWEVRTWQEPWEEPVPVCPCHDISEGEKKSIYLSACSLGLSTSPCCVELSRIPMLAPVQLLMLGTCLWHLVD